MPRDRRKITSMTLTDEERNILDLLTVHTYEEVREQTGWSRGRIYQLVLKCGARKTEQRIRQRAAERAALQREAFEEMLGKTVTADVVDFMGSLPDNSIDLFCSSFPYNLGKKYGGAPGADTMRHVYYHGWIMMIVSEIARTLKDGGTVVAQLGTTKDDNGSTIPLDIMLFEDFKRAGLIFQNRIMWPSQAGLTPKKRLAERYETALVFSKGADVTFFAGAARTPQRNISKRSYKGPNAGKLSCHPLGAHPTDVWNINRLGFNHPEKTAHCAQFPKEFARRVCLLWSLPGALVCDPFSGSGSTQIAAIETGRNFIGADLFYEDIRAKRLADAKPDTYSPFTGVTPESMAIWQAEARKVEASPERPISDEENARMLFDFLDGSAA